MPDTKLSDMSFVTWAMGAMITVILFLTGFGVKDARAQLAMVPELKANVASLQAMIIQLEKRIERLERERDG